MLWTSDLNKGVTQTSEPLNRGSMFTFWHLYLDLLPDDIRSQQNTLFFESGTLFFTRHPKCSVLQMQYLFAITLSEQYESRLGESYMALHWVSKAAEFAEDETQKDEILC
jgi:hypothetical protein